MSNDGSVAPKERVNIVYKAHTGDAQEEVELPFRFLVVGDFTGRADETPVEERELVDVNKDNFDEVLAGHNVSADLSVPDRLADSADEDARLAVKLDIKRMRDFTPDAICQQVPELQSLVGLRDALTVLKGPLGNVPAFRKKLQTLLSDDDAQQKLMAEIKGGDAPEGDGAA